MSVSLPTVQHVRQAGQRHGWPPPSATARRAGPQEARSVDHRGVAAEDRCHAALPAAAGRARGPRPESRRWCRARAPVPAGWRCPSRRSAPRAARSPARPSTGQLAPARRACRRSSRHPPPGSPAPPAARSSSSRSITARTVRTSLYTGTMIESSSASARGVAAGPSSRGWFTAWAPVRLAWRARAWPAASWARAWAAPAAPARIRPALADHGNRTSHRDEGIHAVDARLDELLTEDADARAPRRES